MRKALIINEKKFCEPPKHSEMRKIVTGYFIIDNQ